MSAPVIMGSSLLGSSLLGAKSASDVSKSKEAMSQAQVDEMARQFDITTPQAYKQFLMSTGLGAEGLGEQKRQFNVGLGSSDVLRKAYQEAIGKAEGGFGESEKKFYDTTGKTPEELLQLKQDIAEGSAEGIQSATGQIESSLAKQGVRGGQAGTLLGRATGKMGTEAQRDINRVIAQDASQRQAQRAGYESMLGQMGKQFLLSPTTAQQTKVEGETGDVFKEVGEETQPEATATQVTAESELSKLLADEGKAPEEVTPEPAVVVQNELDSLNSITGRTNYRANPDGSISNGNTVIPKEVYEEAKKMYTKPIRLLNYLEKYGKGGQG